MVIIFGTYRTVSSKECSGKYVILKIVLYKNAVLFVSKFKNFLLLKEVRVGVQRRATKMTNSWNIGAISGAKEADYVWRLLKQRIITPCFPESPGKQEQKK